MKTIIIIVAVLFAGSIFSGLGYMGFKKRDTQEEGLAKVNGRQVDPRRFQQVLENLFRSVPGRKTPQQLAYLQVLALNQVIEYTLMLEDAKRKGVRAGREEVDAALNQIITSNNFTDLEQFKQMLKSRGTDIKTVKDVIRDDITVQKMVDKLKKSVKVNPEDMREVRARHILVRPKIKIGTEETYEQAKERADEAAKEEAQKLLKRVKAGENFVTLAKEHSEDPGSAKDGGDLGYFGVGAMVPEFEKAAFSLKPGEVSELVKTDFGYHIIKLDDTRLRKVEEGKDLNAVILKEKQDRVVNDWMAGIMKDAKIEIINPMFRGHDFRMKGRQAEAIAEYSKLIATDPSNPYIHLLIGDTYLEMNEIKMAISEYKKATSLNSSDPDLFISLGKGYELAMEGFPEEKAKYKKLALEEYRRASLLAADDKFIHQELKGYFENLKAYSDAASEDRKIAEIEKKEAFEKKLREESGGVE